MLVDFWATWCEPCKKEMPGYQMLLDRYGARGFAVIGFKFDTMEDMEDPLQFGEKIGVKHPLVNATDELKQKFGGIEGIPTTMLYDRNGILRQKVIGLEYTEEFEKRFLSCQSWGTGGDYTSNPAPARLPGSRASRSSPRLSARLLSTRDV